MRFCDDAEMPQTTSHAVHPYLRKKPGAGLDFPAPDSYPPLGADAGPDPPPDAGPRSPPSPSGCKKRARLMEEKAKLLHEVQDLMRLRLSLLPNSVG